MMDKTMREVWILREGSEEHDHWLCKQIFEKNTGRVEIKSVEIWLHPLIIYILHSFILTFSLFNKKKSNMNLVI